MYHPPRLYGFFLHRIMDYGYQIVKLDLLPITSTLAPLTS